MHFNVSYTFQLEIYFNYGLLPIGEKGELKTKLIGFYFYSNLFQNTFMLKFLKNFPKY